jgi:hypothetical protein
LFSQDHSMLWALGVLFGAQMCLEALYFDFCGIFSDFYFNFSEWCEATCVGWGAVRSENFWNFLELFSIDLEGLLNAMSIACII